MSARRESWRERLRATWRGPRSLTALVPLRSVGVPEAEANLAALAPALVAALGHVEDLHSFRIVVVPPKSPAEPVRLLLNSVHDDPLDTHLRALAAHAGALFVQAFAAAGLASASQLPDFLMAHREGEKTFYLGSIRRTVGDILAEERLLDTMEHFADQQVEAGRWPKGTPAEQIRREIRAHILAQPDSAGLPAGRASDLTPSARDLRFLDLVVSFLFPALGVLHEHIDRAIERIQNTTLRPLARGAYRVWWLYGAIPTGLAILGVRLLEKMERDELAPPPDPAKVRRLEDVEDLQLKNAVTLWFPVRPTWMRRLLLRVILWGSERGCRHFWTNGALAQIDTIHYARLLQLDGGQTLLFMSDYDGSLDRYLLDFLGVGSSAVIPISSNVAGCPPTKWLFKPVDPPTFGPRWTGLIRTYQLEIPVWYSAYPNLSVRDILSNAELRDGLFTETMTEAEAQRWVTKL